MEFGLPLEDLALRQSVASTTMQELFRGWWIDHDGLCHSHQGQPCDCGLVAWFGGQSKVIGVHANLVYEMYPRH